MTAGDVGVPDRGLEARAAELVQADDWAGLCRELGELDPEALTSSPRAAYAYGEGLYRTGRPRDLAAFATILEASSRRDADQKSTMRALNMAGVAAFELGDVAGASDKFGTLVELAHAEQDTEMLAPAMNNLGAIADLQGRITEAIGFYRRAIPLFETRDRPHGVAQAHHNLGLSYRDRGRLDDAVESHQWAAEIAESVGYRPLVALSLSGRAECEIQRGDIALADQLVARSLTLARELQDPVAQGEALRVRGLVRTEQADFTGAIADFGAAEATGHETGNTLLHAESLRDRGRCLVATGREAEGLESLGRAVDILEKMGAVHKAKSIREESDERAGQDAES